MKVSVRNYVATCSDSNNAFEWLVLVFKDNENVAMHSVFHKPTKEELTKLLWGYVENDI